jgi:LPS export ABC transporter protein LptC
MSPRSVALIIVLAAGAIGSWYLARTHVQRADTGISLEPLHRGYYLKQARILGTGEDGSLLYEILADHAEQQANDLVEFTTVRIRYSPGSDVPWTVNADAATLQEGSPMITLRGHVRIVNSGDSAGGDTEIRTQYLELDPQLAIAETDARVQIRFGPRSVTATGMLASLNDGKIKLKANIRGKIAP